MWPKETRTSSLIRKYWLSLKLLDIFLKRSVSASMGSRTVSKFFAFHKFSSFLITAVTLQCHEMNHEQRIYLGWGQGTELPVRQFRPNTGHRVQPSTLFTRHGASWLLALRQGDAGAQRIYIRRLGGHQEARDWGAERHHKGKLRGLHQELAHAIEAMCWERWKLLWRLQLIYWTLLFKRNFTAKFSFLFGHTS